MLAVHEQGNYQFDGSATSAERYFLSERKVLRQLIWLRLRRRIHIFVNQQYSCTNVVCGLVWFSRISEENGSAVEFVLFIIKM